MLLAASLAAAPLSVAMPGLAGVGLEAGEADLYTELLATSLRARGLKVVTAGDIAQVLGLERQKQLLGCAESGCTAELAAALGVDAIVVGQVGLLGRGYTVTARALAASDAAALASATERAATAEAMPATLERLAFRLAQGLAAARPGAGVVPGDEPSPWQPRATALKRWSLLPLAAGVVSLGVGIGLRAKAQGSYDAMLVAPSAVVAQQHRDAGQVEQAVGFSLIGLGAAAVVTGVVMYVLGHLAVDALEVGVAPVGPGGALAWLCWRWP